MAGGPLLRGGCCCLWTSQQLVLSDWGLQVAKAIRSNLLSAGRPAPPKLLSMSLSTQGLTSFVLFICSPRRGLSGAHSCLAGPATGCPTPVRLEAGPGGPGVVGEGTGQPGPPGSRHVSASGCQMTVVGAAAGAAARAKGVRACCLCQGPPQGARASPSQGVGLQRPGWRCRRPRGCRCGALSKDTGRERSPHQRAPPRDAGVERLA